MADIIKKAIVPKDALLELDWEAEGYLIRYKIKSENKNLSSHWSPVYILRVSDFEDVEGSYFEVLGEDGKTNISVVWDDLYSRPAYDVFVSFRGLELENTFEYDAENFIYHGTTPTHNYSFVKKQGTESVRIIVQPAADKKQIKPKFIIYDSDSPIGGYDEYS